MTRFERREARQVKSLEKVVPATSPDDVGKVETVAEFIVRWENEYGRTPSETQIARARAFGRVL